jgi:hypothetical protein
MPKSRTRKQRSRRARARKQRSRRAYTRRQHGGEQFNNFVQSNVAKPAANNLLRFNKPSNNAGLQSVFPQPGHGLTRQNGRRNLIYGNALAQTPSKKSSWWWPF